MSSSTILIIGQVFLLLIAIAGGLLYYLNGLNDDLLESIERYKDKLKDEKKHAKGLRVTIQDQQRKLNELEAAIASEKEDDEKESERYNALESEYEALQAQIENLEASVKKEKKNAKNLSSELEKSKSKFDELESELAQAKAKISQEPEVEGESNQDFESLYYDLKNAVAFNMNGGEQVLDTLRERLRENGNFQESESLSTLKERYNSLGEMIGVVDDVVIFSEQEDLETKKETDQIDNAEDTVKQVESTLKQAQSFEENRIVTQQSDNEQVNELSAKLDQAYEINGKLKGDLDTTSTQLMAFIAKAKLFAAQKEQIKMHKATQNQMHRNFVNLSNDHKALQRKFNNLEAKNKILEAQSRDSNPETVNKLEDLRKSLETKEAEMDRLKLENEMLEQQFMSISKESDLLQQTEAALTRMESEHQLLEQQFLEVLGELESNP